MRFAAIPFADLFKIQQCTFTAVLHHACTALSPPLPHPIRPQMFLIIFVVCFICDLFFNGVFNFFFSPWLRKTQHGRSCLWVAFPTTPQTRLLGMVRQVFVAARKGLSLEFEEW
jgi:hypothetical protein